MIEWQGYIRWMFMAKNKSFIHFLKIFKGYLYKTLKMKFVVAETESRSYVENDMKSLSHQIIASTCLIIPSHISFHIPLAFSNLVSTDMKIHIGWRGMEGVYEGWGSLGANITCKRGTRRKWLKETPSSSKLSRSSPSFL